MPHDWELSRPWRAYDGPEPPGWYQHLLCKRCNVAFRFPSSPAGATVDWMTILGTACEITLTHPCKEAA